MISDKEKLLKRSLYLLVFFCFLLFCCFTELRAAETKEAFPLVSKSSTTIGLKMMAGFDLDKNKVGLQVSTTLPKSKIETVKLTVDNYSPLYLSLASTTFWLDLNSGEHLLTVLATNFDGVSESATSTVFVPYLQSPYLDLYPLAFYKNKISVIGGQTIYPFKKVIIHLQTKAGERTFITTTSPNGRFNWSGRSFDNSDTEIWAEVTDGSLTSLPSNKIVLRTGYHSIFGLRSSEFFESINFNWFLQLIIFILIVILIVTLLLYEIKRDSELLENFNERKVIIESEKLRQDILNHIDLIADIKKLPKTVALPVLSELKRTLEIAEKYIQPQIRSFSKSASSQKKVAVKNKKVTSKKSNRKKVK